MAKSSETFFYMILIIVLAVTAILLPIIIIQMGRGSPHFIYYAPVDPDDEDSTRSPDDDRKAPVQDDLKEYPDKYYLPEELSEYLDNFTKTRSLLFSMQKIGETKPAENVINEVVMKKKRQRLPMVLIVSGLLANDWGSVLTSIAIMNKFFSDVEKTDRLLTDFSFHFLPLLNPDGYNYSMALPINANWLNNYEGTANGKPSGKNILYSFSEEGQSPQEAKIFKDYFVKYEDRIKAAFFLFTPQIPEFRDNYFVIPQAFMGNGSAKQLFFDELLSSIESEKTGVFKYKVDLDEKTDGRIDQWVLKMTQPDPVLVVNFLSNYRIRAPEVLPFKMKQKGDGIHFIITRLLGMLKAIADKIPGNDVKAE